MSNVKTNSATKKLSTEADLLVKKYVDEFASDLMLQANLLSKQDEMIIASHIRQSLGIIRSKNSAGVWQEIKSTVGGLLFGTFLAGFANELFQSTISILPIVFYTVLGFIGISLSLWGIFEKYKI